MKITPTTKVVGLIGHPVGHSLSPILHNDLYTSLNLDMVYHAFNVKPLQVEAAIGGLCALGFAGFNVTIPHKEAVYRLLHNIDDEARVIGAVNTVKNENGLLIGYNTDGQGYLQSLMRNGVFIQGRRVAVLGAGGAARAICVSLAGQKPESLTIVNRTFHKAERLADLINHYKGKNLATANQQIPDHVDMIINTTCLGMWPDINGNPLYGYSLSRQPIVCDIVYNPRETTMLKYAKAQGCTVFGGLDMLIGQGIRAIEIWLDTKLPQSSWNIMMDAANKYE